MIPIHTGQCGLCAHFGEHHAKTRELIQIRQTRSAPEAFIDECGHPSHAPLHLRVTAFSGCEGFEPASIEL